MIMVLIAVQLLVPLAGGVVMRRLGTSPSCLAAAGASIVALDLLGDVVPVWDLVAVVVMAQLGASLARLARAEVIGSLLGSLLALGLAEVGSRALLPPAPSLPGIATMTTDKILRYLAPGSDELLSTGEQVCQLVFLDTPAGRESQRERHQAATGSPTVLHVGDSVVYGTGVQPEETFVAALDAGSTEAHVNAAIPDTSIDVALAVARRWAASDATRAVVLHVFLVNDHEDVDLGRPCCPDGLLDAEGQLRCDSSHAPSGALRLLHRSGPPLVLWALSDHSVFAAHLYARWARLSILGGRLHRNPTLEATVDRLAELAIRFDHDLTARGVQPVIVVLPRIPGHTPHDSLDQMHEQFLQHLAEAGVHPIDAWRWSVSQPEVGKLYVDPIHFSKTGHAEFAGWLKGELFERLAPPP